MTAERLSRLQELRQEILRLEVDSGHRGRWRLRLLLWLRRRQAAREELKLERYISTIGDSRTRELFFYRYVAGMNWLQVGRMAGISADSAKKAVYRQLQKEEKTGKRV